MPDLTQENIAKMLDFVAARCLLGDRARDSDKGGHTVHPDVVDASGDYDESDDALRVHVKTGDGRTAVAEVNGTLVPRGLGREIRPADLHDATLDALVRAGQRL